MAEHIMVSLRWSGLQGWVATLHLWDGSSGRQEHWTYHDRKESLEHVAQTATDVINEWASWGELSLVSALDGWTYTLDKESASAVAAFSDTGLKE